MKIKPIKLTDILYLFIMLTFILLTFVEGNFSSYLILFLFSVSIAIFIVNNHKDKLFYLELFIVLTMIHTFLLLHMIPKVLPISGKVINILKLWKEVYILFLLFLTFKNKSIKVLIQNLKNLFSKNYRKYEIFMMLFFLIVIIGVFRNDNILAGLYGARNYLEGMLVYYIAKHAVCSNDDVHKLIDNTAFYMVFLCIWGIFQAYVLGGEFLISCGYGLHGKLSYTFYISGFYGVQRVISTFASANTFAVYGQLICIYFLSQVIFNKIGKLKNIVCFIITFIALVLTFSRSSWIGFAVASVFMFIFYIRSTFDKSKFKFKKKYAYITIIVICIISVILASDFETSVMIRKYIVNTITLKDTSAKGHINSVSKSVNFIISNKFGIGVGASGPKSYKYAENSFLNAESSYLIIGMDMGIIGIVSYLLFSLFLLLHIKSSIKNKNDYLYILLFSMWTAVFAAYLFLPLIQELEHVYYIYMLTGLMMFLKNKEKLTSRRGC